MLAAPAELDLVAFDLSCSSCGYNLRGLECTGKCPECGTAVDHSINPPVTHFPPAQIRWARIVSLGLVIWLSATFESIGTVLIMRFSEDYGGTVARLNYIGPKAWAVPLIQRAVGYQPGSWGVNGVTRGLLMAVAVLMITTAPTERDWREPIWSMRFWARWVPLVLFGGFLGLTLGSEGLGYDDPQVRKFTLAAVAGVELPATILLYLHLRVLAKSLGLTRPASTFLWAVMLATLLMIGAAVLLTIGPLLADDRNRFPLQAALGVYMAASLCAAAAALGAITRLLLELMPIALQKIRPHRAAAG